MRTPQVSKVLFAGTPAAPVTKARGTGFIYLLFIPIMGFVFYAGMYLGSSLVQNGSSELVIGGIPNTNNILAKWKGNEPEKNGVSLRGSDAKEAKVHDVILEDIPKSSHNAPIVSPVKILPPKVVDETLPRPDDGAPSTLPPASPEFSHNTAIVSHGKVLPPRVVHDTLPRRPSTLPPAPESTHNAAVVSPGKVPPSRVAHDTLPRRDDGALSSLLSSSKFYASKLTSMTITNTLLDSPVIAVGTYIYLDADHKYRLNNDNALDMRMIFTNKKTGCETTLDQHGISMYVNGWGTSDHKLYVEYGATGSGCMKLDSGTFLIEAETWYYVAVSFDSNANTVDLYINNNLVSQQRDSFHQVQTHRPFTLGQYGNGEFNLGGKMSHFAVLHPLEPFNAHVVDLLMTLPLQADAKAFNLPGLVSYYTLRDDKIAHAAAALDSVGTSHGVYSVIVEPTYDTVDGLGIKLINGVGDNRVVTQEMLEQSDKQGRERRESIKDGMTHAWKAYKQYAWGRDELMPQSLRGQDNWGGMGVTLVDSLDTLWVMGLRTEFNEALNWVKSSLSFDRAGTVSVFETTIRELGGLLSAYDLSKDNVFLNKAVELGNLLMPAFSTPSGIPKGMVNFKTHAASGGWSGNSAILSELGTLQLEFRYLSYATKDKKYEAAAMKPLQVMRTKSPKYGLYPIKVSVSDGGFTDSQVTFGALGDSFYEYLLKVWLQGNRQEKWLRDMYDRAMDGVMSKLLQTSAGTGLAFLGDYNGYSVKRKMDHLVCFMPGALALGAYTNPEGVDSERSKRDLSVAKALMYTCYQMYKRQATGISPEYVEFPANGDMQVGSTAPFYILRPETAESLFILNQLTKDPVYRDWGWEIYSNINRHCRTAHAYGAHPNVNSVNARPDDRMESFFLAETMKYLYLLQDPDNTIDILNHYVINTEAHPLSVFGADHTPVPP